MSTPTPHTDVDLRLPDEDPTKTRPRRPATRLDALTLARSALID